MKKNGRTFDVLSNTKAMPYEAVRLFTALAHTARKHRMVSCSFISMLYVAVYAMHAVAKDDVYSYGEETRGKITSQEYQMLTQKTLEYYVLEKKQCEAYTGNAKEICEVRALGNKNAMIAYIEAQHSGTLESLETARIKRVEATYNTALAMCKETDNPEDCIKKATKIKDNEIAKTRASPKTTKPVTP